MLHSPSTSRAARLAGLLLCAVAAGNAGAAAQLVTPKTVPVHQGEQFDIYPSSRPGLAGVSIALDDTLADPFVNPAKAARVTGGVIFGTPFAHGISDDRGGGRTLPIGGMGSVGSWAVAGVAALQQLDRAGPVWNRPTRDRTAANHYLSLSLARGLPEGLSLGIGGAVAALGAVDGVDLLYGGSDRIEQEGSVMDLRLGLVKEWSTDRAFELLLLHSRTDMTHDVHFPQLMQWDPVVRGPVVRQPERTEHNIDRTHIWGAHTEYTWPVSSDGWRLGWLATANRLSHPKIPNYVIMNIPRDPGTTYAFNAGVGIARAAGPVTFGVDLVYEPIWSETWADAASDTATAGGTVIPAGGRTVENAFRFSNAKVRLGVGREFALGSGGESGLGVQFGLAVHSIDYRLEQTNHVLESFRKQREQWMEWTPTLALRFRGQGLDLSYALRLTCGTGECGVPWFGGDDALVVPAMDLGGIIAAPSGPLFFDSGTMWAHRFSFAIPIRGDSPTVP